MSSTATRHLGGRRHGRGALACALLLPLAAVLAQPAAAQAVIQPIPNPAAGRLADALQTLARDPQSLEALIAAGESSLQLDDLDAAVGFFARAERVAPADGRVKAGTATILLRRDNPAEALRLFAEAERLGAPMVTYAADRGLAFDLVGENANAQAAYWRALSLGPDDAVSRRLAISQAIGGNRVASEATLLPLLQRQDLAAYRARAFALAILGQADEAVSIAETMLPPRLSGRMAPYLRYMTRLTPAQQAAAANLGRFPPAAEIGRDAPALAASVPQTPAPQGSGADARLVPSGQPMGQHPVVQPLPSAAPAARELPPVDEPQPSSTVSVTQPLPSVPPVTAELPPVESAAPSFVTASPVVQPLPSASTVPAPAPEQTASAGEQSAAPLAPPSTAPAAPSAAPAALPPPPAMEPDLASAFADLAQAPRPAPAIVGAVDITTIEPRRERPRPPAPPPPNPSREWVQLATGRDADALVFDWRRIKRQAGGSLDKDKPHLAGWGNRTRLLIGPFANAAEAQAAVRALAGAGVESFRFISAAGEQVRSLD